MRFVIGIGIMLLAMIMMIGVTGGFQNADVFVEFLDAPTLFFLLLVLIAVIVMTGGFKPFIAACNAVFSKNYTLDAQIRTRAVKLFGLMRKTVIVATVWNIVMPTMLLLLQLDDPSHLGAMVSVILVSVIQATIFIFMFIDPMIHLLEAHRNPAEKVVISEKEVVNKLLELCYKNGIAPEDIMSAEEISFHK